MNDNQLLREYADENSERAFAALVERHVNLVHSAALRQVRDPHLAEEITQVVFIIFARKARTFTESTIISGWLYRTARFAAADALKSQYRRQRREQEAAHMDSTPDDSNWEQIAPLLDEAMTQLGEKDRNAVVLRFFEKKPLKEVGAALGVEADAAQKRITRAVDKLRAILIKRGATLSAITIIGLLSSHAVQAAPVGLPSTIAAIATVKGATATASSTVTLIKGTLKIMAWTKLKVTAVVTLGVLLAAGTATVALKEVRQYEGRETYPWQGKKFDWDMVNRQPPQVRILPAKYPHANSSTWGSSNGKMIGLGVGFKDIISEAFGFEFRTIFNEPLPDEEYDYIATLPKNSRETLQREVEKKFGLLVRRELRDTDVLELKVRNRDAAGLSPSNKKNSDSNFSRGHYVSTGQSFTNFTLFLERYFRMPVIDQTGLLGNYDIDLKWNDSDWVHQHPDALNEAMKQAMLEQLGLELVPDNQPLEMLIVEKAK